MLDLVLAAALGSLTLTAPQAKPTFWVDAERFSQADAATLMATVSRMVDDRRLVPAKYREEADLIFVVHLGSFRDQGDSMTPSLTPSSSVGGPDESGPAPSEGESSTVAAVEIRLLDLMGQAVVSEHSLRCRIPIIVGSRVSDAMLRAGLSDTADEAEVWAGGPGGSAVGSAPETRAAYGLTDDARRSLSPAVLATSLRNEASRALRAGHEEAALALLAEAQPLFKQTGERQLEGLAWEELSSLMASTGRPVETARTYAQQAVRIAREIKDPTAEARALVTLAVLEAEIGNYPRALEVLSAARQMAAKEDDVVTEAAALADIAALTALRGGYERARALQESALTLLADAPSRHMEARLRLAMAVVQSHLDARDRAATLREIEAVVGMARDLPDLALEKDARFLEAAVRFGTTDYAGLKQGELAAIRAYRISRELADQRGETAALALLGAFAHRLVRPADAAAYLARALESAREHGYVEIAIDVLQFLGEMAPNAERGIALMDDVLALRRQGDDLRGQVTTLSDQTRLLSGLGETNEAWERYRQSLEVLERYVAARNSDPYAEDVRGSFIEVLKSLAATRSEMPFLVSYLELRNTTVIPHLSWLEATQ